jgi:hypothetical protein
MLTDEKGTDVVLIAHGTNRPGNYSVSLQYSITK